MHEKFRPLPLLAAFVTGMGFYTLGLLLLKQTNTGPWALGVLLALLGAAGLSLLLGKLKEKKFEKLKVAEIRKLMLSEQAEAKKDLLIGERRIKTEMLFSNAAWALGFLLALLLCFLCGGAKGGWAAAGLALFFLPGIYALWGLLGMLLPEKKQPETEDSLPRTEYPLLYETVDGIFAEGKCPARVVPEGGGSVGVAFDGDAVTILLGAYAGGLLKRQELFEVLLHEKGHVNYRDSLPLSRAARLLDRHEKGIDYSLLRPVGALVYYPNSRLAYACMLYETASTRVRELRADEYAREKGTPETACSALFKLSALKLFFTGEYFTPVYRGEEPPKNLFTAGAAAFREAGPRREAFYKALLEKALPPQMGSHPTFRQRWEKLGKPAYGLSFEEEASPYAKEQQKLLAAMDDKAFQQLSQNYPENRKRFYLEPLNTVAAYEEDVAAGKEYPLWKLRTVAEALNSLCRFDELTALCKKAVARAQHPAEAAHFHFMLGRELLKLYDKEGIKEIYAAMDANSNYRREGYDAIGDFCLLMGLEKELLDYRQRAEEEAQRQKDVGDGQSCLNSGDALSFDERLSPAAKQSILSFIKETCNESLLKVYEVKKAVAKDFYSSVFVVGFTPETEEEREQECMDSLFRYLDSLPDWEYSLFLLTRENEGFIKKVSGSLLYPRREPEK